MKFGVLKDIKADEYRVIATPAEVAMIARTGAEVWVQKDAGKGAGFSDEAYAAEGAKIVDTPIFDTFKIKKCSQSLL